MQTVLDTVGDDIAVELAVAGGVGYLLLFAHDDDAVPRVRTALTAHSPNGRARFVDFDISSTGSQVATGPAA